MLLIHFMLNNMQCSSVTMKMVCSLKAILNGAAEVKSWLDYESVSLNEVPLASYYFSCDFVHIGLICRNFFSDLVILLLFWHY